MLTTEGRPVPLKSPGSLGWALRESGRQLVWAEEELEVGVETGGGSDGKCWNVLGL